MGSQKGRKNGYQKVLGVAVTINEKTTTKKGKREYMRKYMKLRRDKGRKRPYYPRKPLLRVRMPQLPILPLPLGERGSRQRKPRKKK